MSLFAVQQVLATVLTGCRGFESESLPEGARQQLASIACCYIWYGSGEIRTCGQHMAASGVGCVTVQQPSVAALAWLDGCLFISRAAVCLSPPACGC